MRLFLFSLVMIGCQNAPTSTPDGVWGVTVTGLETTCVADGPGFQQTYDYQLFFDGSDVQVDIDDESFASGVRSGCSLSYTSSVWLEERDSGDLRWQITGDALYQGAAGGCDLPEGLDWDGEEVVTVVESEDPEVSEGCTYLMSVQGAYQGG